MLRQHRRTANRSSLLFALRQRRGKAGSVTVLLLSVSFGNQGVHRVTHRALVVSSPSLGQSMYEFVSAHTILISLRDQRDHQSRAALEAFSQPLIASSIATPTLLAASLIGSEAR